MRKVFKLNNNVFEECEMKEIKKGDIFKMIEDTGEDVIDKFGNSIFTANSDAYRYKGEIYQVDIE